MHEIKSLITKSLHVSVCGMYLFSVLTFVFVQNVNVSQTSGKLTDFVTN